MTRVLLSFAVVLGGAVASQASFTLTGNPVSDPGWVYKGRSLDNGGYVRGTANFNYNIYQTEFNIPFGANPLTATGWNPGDRVVAIGGAFIAPLTPTQLGYPSGTTFTGNTQNSLLAANARIVGKFGVPITGPAPSGNNFSASTLAPNAGNGLGSHSSGNGGIGSVQVSIAANRFIPANAGILTTPTISFSGPVTGPDNVAQWQGIIGSNGLDLFSAGVFPSARYIFTTDPGTGFLSTWEILLNTTMVQQYPGANPVVPIGGSNWIATVQAGSGAAQFTDGLIKTDTYYPAPAPPAIFLALVGGAGLFGLKRIRK